MLGEAISDPEFLAIPPCACDTNRLGQAWTKADLDGDTLHGHQGGAGSVIAITCLNAGQDGIWSTNDGQIIRPNLFPNGASVDIRAPADCRDRHDQIRGFVGKHPDGLLFVFGDRSVRWLDESINKQVYRRSGTMCDREVEDF
jgi:hypothetical protein